MTLNRTIATIVILCASAAQARAGYSVTPTSVVSVDEIGFYVDEYHFLNPPQVGNGNGFLRTWYINTAATFDLSGGPGGETLRLTGTIDNLRPVGNPTPFNGPALMVVDVYAGAAPSTTDPAGAFHAFYNVPNTYNTTATKLGEFTVDNGIPWVIGGYTQPVVGPDFSLVLPDLGTGPVTLWFVTYGTMVPYGIGGEGNLTNLAITAVPEPGSLALAGIGLAVVAGVGLRRRLRRAGTLGALAAVVVLTAPAARAGGEDLWRFSAGFYPRPLFRELKLTPEQEGKVIGINIRMDLEVETNPDRTAATLHRGAEEVEALLTGEQRARLGEIKAQLVGTQILTEPGAIQFLGLSPATVIKIRPILDGYQAEVSRQGALALEWAAALPKSTSPEEANARREEVDRRCVTMALEQEQMRRRRDAEVMKLLTEGQRNKLKAFTGEPFDWGLPRAAQGGRAR
jgi:hypothetical protein